MHAGTALLQSIAEFASSPLSHRINRLVKIAGLRRDRISRGGSDTASIEAIESDILDTQTALELKKLHFFVEYKYAAAMNTIVAFSLFGLLVWAAACAESTVSDQLAFFLVFVSAGPALISLGVLWWRWDDNTAGIRTSIKEHEDKLFDRGMTGNAK